MGSSREKIQANPITIRIFLVLLRSSKSNSTTSYIWNKLQISINEIYAWYMLWFDVEKRYNTMMDM